MTLTNPQIAELLADLEQCGISPFNVYVYDNGVVAFHSGGLSPEEVWHAQRVVACQLMILATANK